MQSLFKLPWLFLGSAAALAPSQSVPPQAASSVLSNAINYNIAGGSPDSIRHGGPWHWQPGQGHAGRPGWGQHPHGPGHCIQIQNKFPPGTNGPRSESANRAAAVKVCSNFYADILEALLRWSQRSKPTSTPGMNMPSTLSAAMVLHQSQ